MGGFTATKWMYQQAPCKPTTLHRARAPPPTPPLERSHANRAVAAQSLHQLTIIHTTAMQLVRTPSTTMSTTPPRESFSTFSLSRAFGSLADTRHCAIGSHTPSTTMSTTPPMDSDLTHIKGPERLTKRVTVARLEPYVDSSRGGTSGRSPSGTLSLTLAFSRTPVCFTASVLSHSSSRVRPL